MYAKFREIQNNFVQMSCFAKFEKCCFAATLLDTHLHLSLEVCPAKVTHEGKYLRSNHLRWGERIHT